jgi:hypothetical protein
LKPGFIPKAQKAFSLPLNEVKLAEEFVKENLEKEYIQSSISPQSLPLFFVNKKDRSKRPCQDYHYLNEWTIKNPYPLPLIQDLIDGLQGKKYFTKTYDRDTTISAYAKEMNGKQLFECQWAYTNPQSCSLDCAIHQQHFNRLWTEFSRTKPSKNG